ncbi:MAG: hypothetical protein IKX91_03240, partial [Firmicutes bacterium]|nr:hypothetical protein [Bacillota bacterium]
MDAYLKNCIGFLDAAPSPFHAAIVVYVMGLITALMRIRIHEHDEAALPEGRWLLVGNHRSAFDPIV